MLEANMCVTNGIPLKCLPHFLVDVVNCVATLKAEHRSPGWGTVRVFEQNVALEDAIGPHACSLEALACVCPMTFLSGVHLLLPLPP